MRAEVYLQLQRCQLQRCRSLAQAMASRQLKQLDLRLAKHINRLHRVAHQEACTLACGLPASGKQCKQLILAARSILEFVDQQMTPPPGNLGCQLAELALFIEQNLPRGET